MKKILLSVLIFTAFCFAIDDATVPNIFVPLTPANASEINENYDSLEIAINRIADSLNNDFIRFSDLDSADTNFNKVFIDTIISTLINTDTLNSANGLFSPTVNTGNGDVECFAMDQDVQQADGVTFGTVAAATVNTGNGDNELYPMDQGMLTTDDVTHDSLFVNEIVTPEAIITHLNVQNDTAVNFVSDNVDIGGGVIDSTVIGGSVTAAGAFTTITSDSVYTTKIESPLGLFTTLSIDSLNATSLQIINANIDTLTIDTAYSSKIETPSLNADGGTLDGVTIGGSVEAAAYVDTLHSVKGITATTVNTGQGNNELYPMDHALLSTSDVTFDSLYTSSGVRIEGGLGIGTIASFPIDLSISGNTDSEYGIQVSNSSNTTSAAVKLSLFGNTTGFSFNAYPPNHSTRGTECWVSTSGLTKPLVLSQGNSEMLRFGADSSATFNGDVYSVPWTDYYSTSTITGLSSTTRSTLSYKKLGKTLFIELNFGGTSNLGTFTFTLPYNIQSSLEIPAVVFNDGVRLDSGFITTLAGSNTLSVFRDGAATAFTSSGFKNVSTTFQLEIE